MAAGDFAKSLLPDILVGAEQVWKGDRHRRGILKDVSTANEILGRQMVDWDILFDRAGLNKGNSCIGAKAAWLKACDDTVDECDDNTLTDCNLSGPETESDNAIYAPNMCFEKSGKVLDNQCKDMFDKGRKIGVQMANIIASLEQEIQAVLIAHLLANGQENRYSGTYGTILTVAEDGEAVTTFPAAQWTPDIIAEMVATAENNDFYNPYIISGKNLWSNAFISEYKQNCCNTDGLVNGDGPIPIFFDLKNVDQSAGGTQTSILVDAGALGYFNVTDYENESPEPFVAGGDLLVWRVPSRRLSYMNGDDLVPIYFDIEIQEVCTINETTNKKYVSTVIKGTHQGGLHAAPATCNADDTGILIFEKEAEVVEEGGEGEGE